MLQKSLKAFLRKGYLKWHNSINQLFIFCLSKARLSSTLSINGILQRVYILNAYQNSNSHIIFGVLNAYPILTII